MRRKESSSKTAVLMIGGGVYVCTYQFHAMTVKLLGKNKDILPKNDQIFGNFLCAKACKFFRKKVKFSVFFFVIAG